MARTAFKIRDAVVGDESAIAELGREFFKEAAWTDITDWNHDKATNSLKAMIENNNCVLLVAEIENKIIGMAGGFVQEIWFSNENLGQELFWYIDPNSRGGVGSELLKALEEKLKENGANIIAMIGLEKTKSLNNYFLRKGYRASEYSYIKRL